MPCTTTQLLPARVTSDTPSQRACVRIIYDQQALARKVISWTVFCLCLQFSVWSGKKAESGRVEIKASFNRRRKSPNENFHISLNLNYFDSFPNRRHRLNARTGTALSDVYRLSCIYKDGAHSRICRHLSKSKSTKRTWTWNERTSSTKHGPVPRSVTWNWRLKISDFDWKAFVFLGDLSVHTALVVSENTWKFRDESGVEGNKSSSASEMKNMWKTIPSIFTLIASKLSRRHPLSAVFE